MQRAEELIAAACLWAGSMSFIDDIDAEARSAGLANAVAAHDTPPIYNWLVRNFSYQGISDQVARGYIERHGSADWDVMAKSVDRRGGCPKLDNYWQFDACRYDKGSRTCAEADHIGTCSLPRLPLRNGRLNQTAFSLFLFIRDIAGSDLVGWMDRQLAAAAGSKNVTLQTARQEALIGPLRNVFGVADKVLTMTLSVLMIGARTERPDWFETGTAMVTIDTLVHNFMCRTGILQDCGVAHVFGPGCYRAGGCADIIRAVADRIDARQFNPRFPSTFARWIQHAVWRYCAADGLNICNGVKIDDRRSCTNTYCRLGADCQRLPLKPI